MKSNPRALIAENLRQLILDRVPDGGRMLEWGSGGSTLWFLPRLAARGCHLVTVEHSQKFSQQMQAAVGRCLNWTLFPGRDHYCPGDALRDESPMVVSPGYLVPDGLDLSIFDVILVDGIVRGACLARACMEGKPGGAVFLHDYKHTKRRGWYEWAIRFYGQAPVVHTPSPGASPGNLAELVVPRWTREVVPCVNQLV